MSNRQHSIDTLLAMNKALFCFFFLCFYHPNWGLTQSETFSPPSSLRVMAEWEETEYLALTWAREFETLREIVRHAQEETQVLIICRDSARVRQYLLAGDVRLHNVSYLIAPYNSVWVRDYGGISVYEDNVNSLHLADLIYNRPRPDDDQLPKYLAHYLSTSRVDMENNPWDLVHIGGNFMTDGRGIALSTRLLIDENSELNRYVKSPKSEEEIKDLLKQSLGIHQYLALPKLPHDPIHHLDMHLKLLNEETILLGEYPVGIADGAQIEENLRILLRNFPTASGQPWKIVRIPMPHEQGLYPDSPGVSYRTYTNAVFVNRMLLVPQYGSPQDSLAIKVLKDALPGYKIIGIDSRQLIRSAGALHCVTLNVGSANPLLIQHSPQQNTPFAKRDHFIEARMMHASGIKSAQVFYQKNGKGEFIALPMISSLSDGNKWFAYLPQQAVGTKIRYFFRARAYSGKVMLRPMPAPEAYFEFQILEPQGDLPR